MSEPQKGYKRVRMVRHEYQSEGWASVHRGRLLAGNVYDIPEKDANGNPVVQKWMDMGIAVPSSRNMTTREEELERAGEYDPYKSASTAASVRRLVPDAPVQSGLSEEQALHPGPSLPPGGLPEMSVEDAQRMEQGKPLQGQVEMGSGAFSPEQLSEPSHDEDARHQPFNRNQLKALADAGYVSQEDMDKASDDDLDAVEGVGKSSIATYREMREADRKAEEQSRGSQSGPIEGR